MQLEILDGAFDAMAYEIEERAACSQGLELRYPFFNHKIIQLAFSTPERLRSRGTRGEANSSPRAGGSSARAGAAAGGQGRLHGHVPPPAGPVDRPDPAATSFPVVSIGSRPERRTRSATRTAIPRRPGGASGGCGRSSAVMPSCKHVQTPSPAPFEARRRECYSFEGDSAHERRIGAATRRQKARIQEAGSEDLWSRPGADRGSAGGTMNGDAGA